jgi:hypothetical protein
LAGYLSADASRWLVRRAQRKVKMKTHKVGEAVILAASKHAQRIMDSDPKIKEAWLDLHRSVKISDTRSGDNILRCDTDYDWPVAFLVWYTRGDHLLPREK